MLGTITLLAALIIQIGYTGFCLVKKSFQPKVRSMIRIGAFLVFCILLVMRVYEWGVYWILLFLLLAVCALTGVIYMIRKSVKEKPFHRGRAILSGTGGILLLSLCILPAIVLPHSYRLPQITGGYQAATISYTYTDSSRIETFTDTGENRKITAQFWYPENVEGSWPLLVFSHGAFGIRESNVSTYTELASHGYVVCSLDHPYHSFFSETTDGEITVADMGYMEEVINANTEAGYTIKESYALYQKWMKLRRDDINFVMDTILEEVKAGNDTEMGEEEITESKAETKSVFQLINVDKIGVFGHSMGGAASVWIGREREDIDAVINIDAPYFSELVYDEKIDDFAASNEIYETPILNIYSDDVWALLDTGSAYAANKVAEENCVEVHTAYLRGAKHLSLTDLALSSPVFAGILQGGRARIDKYDCLETMNQIIVEFCDCYLKDTGSFTASGTFF